VVFGRLRSIAAASNIGIGIFIFLISSFSGVQGDLPDHRGIWSWPWDSGRSHGTHVDKNIVPQHKKMIFKKNTGFTIF
jgi:hypothetical protein